MTGSEMAGVLEERYGVVQSIATGSGPPVPEITGNVNAAAGRFVRDSDVDRELEEIDRLYQEGRGGRG